MVIFGTAAAPTVAAATENDKRDREGRRARDRMKVTLIIPQKAESHQGGDLAGHGLDEAQVK
jgi:hypothetical protein